MNAYYQPPLHCNRSLLTRQLSDAEKDLLCRKRSSTVHTFGIKGNPGIKPPMNCRAPLISMEDIITPEDFLELSNESLSSKKSSCSEEDSRNTRFTPANSRKSSTAIVEQYTYHSPVLPSKRYSRERCSMPEIFYKSMSSKITECKSQGSQNPTMQMRGDQQQVLEKIAFIMNKVRKCSIHRMRSLKRSNSDLVKSRNEDSCHKRQRFHNVQRVNTNQKLDEYDDGQYLVCDLSPADRVGIINKTPSGQLYRNRWESFSQRYWDHYTKTSESSALCFLNVYEIKCATEIAQKHVTEVMRKHSIALSHLSSETKTSMFSLLKSRNIPLLKKRSSPKPPSSTSAKVFGQPLCELGDMYGDVMPKLVRNCCSEIYRRGLNSEGIFRLTAKQVSYHSLKSSINEGQDIDFNNFAIKDIAVILKQFVSEIPDTICTRKVSDILICTFRDVPKEKRLEAVKSAILLMPDENRQLVHSMLLFLSDICKHHKTNRMTESNIGIVFGPNFFSSEGPPLKPSSNLNKQVENNFRAGDAVEFLISNVNVIFNVNNHILDECQKCAHNEKRLKKLDEIFTINYKSNFESVFKEVLKKSTENTGWSRVKNPGTVSLHYHDPDDIPLRVWRGGIDVPNTTPEKIIECIRNRRLHWDVTMADGHVVDAVDENIDIFHRSHITTPPHPYRDFVSIRAWKFCATQGILVEESVDFPEPIKAGAVRGRIYQSHFIINAVDSKSCRVIHILQKDFYGRSPEFYKHHYGRYVQSLLTRLREDVIREESS